ncbi:hypothetical protein LCGC14_0667110 [marine sediment metagenome]|uniref:Uncharacterized protein n=1 Tax=marine sediment metagenome TaxID=412755 RepID=A0A0F9QX31_9ZZZZ
MAKTMFMFCRKCDKKVKFWDNRGTEKESKLGAFVCSICNNVVADRDKSKSVTSGFKQSNFVGTGVPASMYTAWVTSIVVAFINNGTIKTIPKAIEAVEKLADGIGKALNKTSTKNPAVEEELIDSDSLGSGLDAEENLSETTKELEEDFNLNDLDL